MAAIRDRDNPEQVTITALGRFEVTVAGVRFGPWGSRKARDILRILVSRRGRSVPREELGELLWPGEMFAAVGHRLSVALSRLRGTLGPCVLSDNHSVALDLRAVEVDVELFLAEAAQGWALRRTGQVDEARLVLAQAERRYLGEVFGDDPYASWSVHLREEARATHLRVERELIDLARDAGDVDEAVIHLTRLVAIEPYDEQAHLDLIDLLKLACRHGEAQRAMRRYEAAMADLGPATG